MKPHLYLKPLVILLLCVVLPIRISWASPLSPRMPSSLNFQSLNEISPPTTEADWTFEMSKLDMAICSSHISGLRARSSDMYLLQYMLLHYIITTDTDQLAQLQSYATANGYDVESAFLHYYDDTTSTINGQSVTIPGYGGGTATSLSQARVKDYIWTDYGWIYNPKSQLVRKFLGSYYRKQMTTGNKPDGIFVDFIMPLRYYVPPAASGGHIVEYSNKTQDQFEPEYQADVAAAFTDVNLAMGSDSPSGDRIMLPNIGYLPENEAIGFAADGILTEFWIQAIQPTFPYAYDLANRLAAANKVLIFTQGTSDPQVASAGNYSSAADRHQLFALTNYWIAKQGKSTYYQQKAPTGYPLLSSFWCKAREFDVGTPVDPLYCVWKTGTDSVGQSFTIYKREYTKALMLNRPKVGYTYSDYSTSSQAFDLGGTYKLLHADGTLGPSITSIGLAMGEAATLLKVDGIPPPDTTAPTISGIGANNITSSAATISWSTNEVATGSAEYGVAASYGSSATALGASTSHNITLTGLSPTTLYHYRVNASDAANNKSTSGDYTFTTTQSGVLPGPKLPSTLNYQALNVVPVPQTEAEWLFEMSHLDLAYGSDHISGLRQRASSVYLLQYLLLHYMFVSDAAGYAELQSFATAHSYDVEDAFLHFYDDTTVRYADGTAEDVKGWGGGTAANRQAARVKCSGGGVTSWAYNMKSPLMQAYLGDLCRRTVATGSKPNGVYADGCKPLPSIVTTTAGGHIAEYANKTANDAASDYLADVTAAYKAVNTAMGQDDPLGDHFLLPSVSNYLAAFTGLGASGADGLIGETNIQEDRLLSPAVYDTAKQFGDARKILVLGQGQYAPVIVGAPSNYSSDQDRHQMDSLCEYWMARQGNSTYYSQSASGIVPLSSYWCKAREYDIGSPVDPLYSIWKTGTDSAGQNYTIYKRAYSKGLVLSRPKVGYTYSDYATQSPLYDLGGTYKLLHSDGILGPELTKIGLAMGEGVTLVQSTTTPPPPASGTPRIAISITVDKQSARVGEQLTYTVSYTNTGDGAATSAVVSADVDSHVTFVSATGGGAYDSTARAVRWTVGTVTPGTSASVRYTVTVN